jgi:hypothetical protein
VHASVSAALTTGFVGELAAHRDALDERYFDLTQRSELDPALGPKATSAFHQARAASAVVLLLEGELLESLYESLHSAPDSGVIRRTALRALETGT